jgi:hypothetical protein
MDTPELPAGDAGDDRQRDPDPNTQGEEHNNERNVPRFRWTAVVFGTITTLVICVAELHGMWREWWVEYLVVPLFIVCAILAIFEFLELKTRISTQDRVFWAAAVGIILTGCTIRLYRTPPAPIATLRFHVGFLTSDASGSRVRALNLTNSIIQSTDGELFPKRKIGVLAIPVPATNTKDGKLNGKFDLPGLAFTVVNDNPIDCTFNELGWVWASNIKLPLMPGWGGSVPPDDATDNLSIRGNALIPAYEGATLPTLSFNGISDSAYCGMVKVGIRITNNIVEFYSFAIAFVADTNQAAYVYESTYERDGDSIKIETPHRSLQ